MAKYGKLINGELRVMPWNTVHNINGVNTALNDPAALLALGYKQVFYTNAPPSDGSKIAVPHWSETEKSIIQTWEMVERPVDTTPTTEERLEALEAAMLELLGGVLDG